MPLVLHALTKQTNKRTNEQTNKKSSENDKLQIVGIRWYMYQAFAEYWPV